MMIEDCVNKPTCTFECIYQFTTSPPVKSSILRDKGSFNEQFPTWESSIFKWQLEFDAECARRILKRKLKIKEGQIQTEYTPFLAKIGSNSLFSDSVNELRFLVIFTISGVSEKVVKSETALCPFFVGYQLIIYKFIILSFY